MPNHVSQDLWVSGPTESIKHFIEFAQETEENGDVLLLSANKFIPYPKNFAGIAGYNAGGYEWCIKNWGTKWGIYNCKCRLPKKYGKSKSTVFYTFNSAWSPAIKIIDAMSKQYPELTFKLKFYEHGMQFKGVYIVQNNVVLKNEESKYKGSRGG